MAGGIFKPSQPKIRPGTYVNVVNGKVRERSNSKRGIGLLPLVGYDWGPRDTWIKLSSDSPDSAKNLLGRSVDDDNIFMLMLRLMFMNVAEVYVYITGGGAKAAGTMETAEGTAEITAKYPGELGNKIKLVSVANPMGGFDVSVMLGASEVELFEGVTAVADLTGSSYVEVSGEGELKAFASLTLTGGNDDKDAVNASVTKFLDASEKIKFNSMAFPVTDESLIAAAISKIRYIRNAIGWKCTAVVANTASDYEGIFNLTNAFAIDGVELTPAQAAAWLAGADAGASYTTTLTYKTVEGATAVVGEKTNEQSEQAIKNGETFFSVSESGQVILEYDVNSKVTFTEEDPQDINKGRPRRVYDTLANDLLLTFVPGKYNNAPEDWGVMEGLGKALLQRYSTDGAAKDVNLEQDFQVDREKSEGNRTYITVGIRPMDSAEKYYFTAVAR